MERVYFINRVNYFVTWFWAFVIFREIGIKNWAYMYMLDIFDQKCQHSRL